MAADQVFDLDVLVPDKRVVKLLGREVDISFIPAGVAMKIDQSRKRLAQLMDGRDVAELVADPEWSEASMAHGIESVILATGGAFTSEELLKECTEAQVSRLVDMIQKQMYGAATAAEIERAEDAGVAEGQNGGAKKNAPADGAATTSATSSPGAAPPADGPFASASSAAAGTSSMQSTKPTGELPPAATKPPAK